MHHWNSLEGKSLPGSYLLEALLRVEGDQAWFSAHCRQRPVVVLVAPAGKNGIQLSTNLEAASRIRHPNLIALERTGRARMEGLTLVYAVLEATEENLADVLRERPLTADETAQITERLVAALGAIHEHGMVHGRVTPANVFAVGETIKLRSDCISNTAESVADPADAVAQDVGDLGALIFQSLTQRMLTSPHEPAIATLPAPFRAIVQRSVTGRWSLTDISAALKKTTIEPRHPIPAGMKQADLAVIERTREPRVTSPRPRAAPAKWQGFFLYAAIAVLTAIAALLFLAWYFNRGTADALSSSTMAAIPAPPLVAAQPVSASTPAAPATTSPTDNATTEDATPAAEDRGWRVVLYTFTDEKDAQQKVDSLLERHPELHPEIFSPSGLSPYLVTVGGAMTRDAALALRTQLARAGYPRDSYAQSYPR